MMKNHHKTLLRALSTLNLFFLCVLCALVPEPRRRIAVNIISSFIVARPGFTFPLSLLYLQVSCKPRKIPDKSVLRTYGENPEKRTSDEAKNRNGHCSFPVKPGVFFQSSRTQVAKRHDSPLHYSLLRPHRAGGLRNLENRRRIVRVAFRTLRFFRARQNQHSAGRLRRLFKRLNRLDKR